MIKPDLKARVLRAAEIYRKHGVTQDEVAEVVGASQPQVSRVLKGDGLRTTKLLEEICLHRHSSAKMKTTEMSRTVVITFVERPVSF